MTAPTTNPVPHATSPGPAELDARLAAFTAVVDAVPADRWDAPTPCADWVARDVVDHVITTEREFLDRQQLAPAPEDDTVDPAVRWHAHVDQVQAVVTPEVFARELAGYFGPSTIGATLAGFYGFDLIVHRWDLARALGAKERWSDDELDAVEASIAQFGDAMYAEGICAPARSAPAGADRQTRLLAAMGRTA